MKWIWFAWLCVVIVAITAAPPQVEGESQSSRKSTGSLNVEFNYDFANRVDNMLAGISDFVHKHTGYGSGNVHRTSSSTGNFSGLFNFSGKRNKESSSHGSVGPGGEHEVAITSSTP